MSNASGMTDERAALMLELLGTIVQRFDRVDKGLVAVGKIAGRQTKGESVAPSGLSTMSEDDLRILVRETAAVGAEIGMRQSVAAMSDRLQATITVASERDRRAVRELIEHSQAQTALIRRWALASLCWALVFGFSIGTFFQLSI